jgi:hypothetical protein
MRSFSIVSSLAGGTLLVLLSGAAMSKAHVREDIVPATDRAIISWTTDALHKVRPHDPIPQRPEHEVHIWAAQNEFEPFQIVLRTDKQAVTGVDVEVTDLTGDGGAIQAKDYVTIYLEKYIHITTPSSIEGEVGEWPDALIPRVDRYAGQRRNAFPVTLTAQRNQPVWVDVYVPMGTAPGEYKGRVLVTIDGRPDQAIPVTLEVWNFTLPSTSSLRTSFGFNGTAAVKEHFGKYTNDRDLFQLTRLYQKAALLHRLSTHGGRMVAPRIPVGGSSIDWTAYDAEIAPFLNGTVLTANDPLPAASATTADLRIPPGLTEEQRQPYFPQWIRHFREHKWSSRLFYYLWDEPTRSMDDDVAALGRAAHQADPGVRNLVTVARNQALQGVVDIWVPLINCLEMKPGFPPYCDEFAPRDAYQSELAAGRGLWWYQSCASHGCNIIGGDYFRGWPSYMIDASPVGNRIFQWLAWKGGIEGELYFNMDESFGRGGPALEKDLEKEREKDPWETQLLFGGNGDGTLFYPGKTSRIGGDTDIPIESIRLKLIREGLEDYEYLHLCERFGLKELATRVAAGLASSLYQWDHRPESLYAYRRQMGEALSRKSGHSGAATFR